MFLVSSSWGGLDGTFLLPGEYESTAPSWSPSTSLARVCWIESKTELISASRLLPTCSWRTTADLDGALTWTRGIALTVFKISSSCCSVFVDDGEPKMLASGLLMSETWMLSRDDWIFSNAFLLNWTSSCICWTTELSTWFGCFLGNWDVWLSFSSTVFCETISFLSLLFSVSIFIKISVLSSPTSFSTVDVMFVSLGGLMIARVWSSWIFFWSIRIWS